MLLSEAQCSCRIPEVMLWLSVIPARVGPAPRPSWWCPPLENQVWQDGNPIDGKEPALSRGLLLCMASLTGTVLEACCVVTGLQKRVQPEPVLWRGFLMTSGSTRVVPAKNSTSAQLILGRKL